MPPPRQHAENTQNQHPRKNSCVKFTTQVTCNPYLFKERLSVMCLLSLSHFPCPSMDSALDHGRPREKEEICDLSPKLKQNPILLHAVSLIITISLVTIKSEIVPCNACINKHNECQLPGSGFHSSRSTSSSVFSLSHPHPRMPHSPFFSAS